MDSAFRRSYYRVREALDEALALPGADRARLAADLWSVKRVVDQNAVLRRSLADPSREGEDKAALAERLFGGKVGDLATYVAKRVAAARWADPATMSRALERAGVEAELAHAEANGNLDRVQDELFGFGRVVEGSPELQAALTDRRADDSAKAALVERLLADRSAPETVALARQAATGTRSRFDTRLAAFLEQASERRQQLMAVVTSAVPLAPEQERQLAEGLSRRHGRAIQIQSVVDPEVLGGLRVEIGDEVIDGTVGHRLADVRRRMTVG